MRRLLSWSFVRHLLRLHLGLFLFGLAVAVMLEARIGLDPWSALHEGVSEQIGWSFGRVSQVVGGLLILSSRVTLQVRPGVGTIFNMAVVGPWVDLLRVQPWLPHPSGLVLGTSQFLVGVLIMGLAAAVYIGARLGAGPRDGFVLGLSRQSGWSIRGTRIRVELVVLGIALLIGGSIGLGTLLFAFLMGPSMQAAFKVFRVSKDPSPSFATEDAAVPTGAD